MFCPEVANRKKRSIVLDGKPSKGTADRTERFLKDEWQHMQVEGGKIFHKETACQRVWPTWRTLCSPAWLQHGLSVGIWLEKKARSRGKEKMMEGLCTMLRFLEFIMCVSGSY